jgi:hypothetical protein
MDELIFFTMGQIYTIEQEEYVKLRPAFCSTFFFKLYFNQIVQTSFLCTCVVCVIGCS